MFAYLNIWLDRSIHICLIAFCLTLPLSKGVAAVAMVALLLLSLVKCGQDLKAFFFALKKNKIALVPATLWLAYAWSLTYNTNLDNGLLLLYRQISLLVIPFVVVVNYSFIRQHLPQYFTYLVAGTLINVLATLFFFCLPDAMASSWADSISFLKPYPSNQNQLLFGLYSPFIDRIQLSNLVAIATLFSLWLAMTTKWKKIFLTTALSLLFFSLLLGGRGAQIGLLIALLVWLIGAYFRYVHVFLQKKIGKFFAISILGIGLLFAGVILPYITYQTVPSVFTRYNQLFWELKEFSHGRHLQYDYLYFTSIRRLVYGKNAWQLIEQQPITGVGIGDYYSELSQIYSLDGMDIPMNIHLQWLYIWGCSGLFGLLLFLAALFWWGSQIMRHAPPLMRTFALSFWLFYLIVMCFDAVLRMQIDCMLFAFGISCLGIMGGGKFVIGGSVD